jgi:hypothetical protein
MLQTNFLPVLSVSARNVGFVILNYFIVRVEHTKNIPFHHLPRTV